MMIALVVPGFGGRDVTRAKKLMSAFMRGQGSVPFRPIPRRVGVGVGVSWWSWGVVSVVLLVAVRIGVVATMRVSGRVWGRGLFVGGGIVRFFLSFLLLLVLYVAGGEVVDGGGKLDVFWRVGYLCDSLSGLSSQHNWLNLFLVEWSNLWLRVSIVISPLILKLTTPSKGYSVFCCKHSERLDRKAHHEIVTTVDSHIAKINPLTSKGHSQRPQYIIQRRYSPKT